MFDGLETGSQASPRVTLEARNQNRGEIDWSILNVNNSVHHHTPNWDRSKRSDRWASTLRARRRPYEQSRYFVQAQRKRSPENRTDDELDRPGQWNWTKWEVRPSGNILIKPIHAVMSLSCLLMVVVVVLTVSNVSTNQHHPVE